LSAIGSTASISASIAGTNSNFNTRLILERGVDRQLYKDFVIGVNFSRLPIHSVSSGFRLTRIESNSLTLRFRAAVSYFLDAVNSEGLDQAYFIQIDFSFENIVVVNEHVVILLVIKDFWDTDNSTRVLNGIMCNAAKVIP
jgi:hypothetical protein